MENCWIDKQAATPSHKGTFYFLLYTPVQKCCQARKMTQKWKTTCSQKGKFFRPVAVKIRDILHRVTRPYLDGWIDKQAATDNFPPSRAYFRQNLGPLLQFF